MNYANTRWLVARHPELFSLYSRGSRMSNMCFGFECGDGWCEIIDRLASIIDAARKLTANPVYATQVKEKFGTLRFYVNGAPGFVYEAIYHAESLTEHVCELCGKTGRMGHTGYWVMTRCDKCAPEGFEAYE